MEAVAKLMNCPMSERKMRLVADIIRGQDVTKALGVLHFSRKEAGVWLSKLLKSAIANWKVKTGLEPDDYALYIKTIMVNQGPQLKRFQPAPQGRAHRIRKHSNHITIVVENRIPEQVEAEVPALAEA